MKRVGELAELRFQLQCHERGWTVSKPYGDNARYDFIVDTGKRLLRVQVKSALTPGKQVGRTCYKVSSAYAGGSGPKIRYTPDDVDFIAAYLQDCDVWYLIPITEIRTVQICLYSGRTSRGLYGAFKESWPLLS